MTIIIDKHDQKNRLITVTISDVTYDALQKNYKKWPVAGLPHTITAGLQCLGHMAVTERSLFMIENLIDRKRLPQSIYKYDNQIKYEKDKSKQKLKWNLRYIWGSIFTFGIPISILIYLWEYMFTDKFWIFLVGFIPAMTMLNIVYIMSWRERLKDLSSDS